MLFQSLLGRRTNLQRRFHPWVSQAHGFARCKKWPSITMAPWHSVHVSCILHVETKKWWKQTTSPWCRGWICQEPIHDGDRKPSGWKSPVQIDALWYGIWKLCSWLKPAPKRSTDSLGYGSHSTRRQEDHPFQPNPARIKRMLVASRERGGRSGNSMGIASFTSSGWFGFFTRADVQFPFSLTRVFCRSEYCL